MRLRRFFSLMMAVAMCISLAGCGNGTGEKENNVDNSVGSETGGDSQEDVVLQDYLKNPITSTDEDDWYDYGIGDPFVMRYDGLYYLYMSTRDNEIGVKCFTSKDLVNWTYQGLVTEEAVTKGAYAPEVVYYNGKFYMYSSPAGNGHYAFESDSPLGPFTKASTNFGLSIDGSVFIDDDGSWYFYHAGDEGILCNKMSSPTDVSQRSETVGAYMNGWTEGPCVIKNDGKYYITYTGNHVLARGYRIDTGTGASATEFTSSSYNPILLNTSDEVYGIGHSSTVKGPNLDSYYIVYHSLIGRATEGMPKRVMNVDRLEFNGDIMTVLGPTTTEQDLPSMPDLYSYFDNEKSLDAFDVKHGEIADGRLSLNKGIVLSKNVISGDLTAEFNISSVDTEGLVGGYFRYVDDKNYGRFYVDLSKGNVTVEMVTEGSTDGVSFEIPKSFDEAPLFNVNETFQIELNGSEGTIYYNDRLLGKFLCNLESGNLGYFTEGATGSFSFLGASNVVSGDSVKTLNKPLPATLQAVHAATLDGFDEVAAESDSTSIKASKAGATATYNVNVKEDATYTFSMEYRATGDGEVKLYLDDALVGAVDVAAGSDTAIAVGRMISLNAGNHVLKLEASVQDITIDNFTFETETEVADYTYEFEGIINECFYSDGSWRMKDGILRYNATDDTSTGKQLFGEESYGDYTVEANLTFESEDIYSGLLVRCSNPSLGAAGSDAVAGYNFLQGYAVTCMPQGILLQKLNYNSVNVAKYAHEIKPGDAINLKVEAIGNNIKVYLNGDLAIDYTDTYHPALTGAVGIRTMQSSVALENLSITH